MSQDEVRAGGDSPRLVPGSHDDPCVCGAYDRCKGVRLADALRAPTKQAAIRAMHRAYND